VKGGLASITRAANKEQEKNPNQVFSHFFLGYG
jgi:hypothetical protein